MAIRPEHAGMPPEERQRLRHEMVQTHERRIDEVIRRLYRPGEPLRVPLDGRDVDAVAAALVERYRAAGWHHARVERDLTRRFVVLEP